MSAVLELVRPEIRELHAYEPAQYEDGMLRLNANESAWAPPGDAFTPGLNRYPEARPDRLTNDLAQHYGVARERLIVTRGSSEAIDLLIRCFCSAGANDIVICPPTFGMYAVYARIQAAGVREVPLLNADGFSLDVAAIQKQWDERCKLLFLCSPNNPTGNSVDAADVANLCQALDGRGVVIIDAAYAEFASDDQYGALLERYDNLVILRTLSKALGIAGARCGVAMANPVIIEMLGRILAPYAFSTPSEQAVLASLSNRLAGEFDSRLKRVRAERRRVSERLSQLDDVVRVWPSDANFLLVQVKEPQRFIAAARAGQVLIRDFSKSLYTTDCIRVTIGSESDNDQLLAALE